MENQAYTQALEKMVEILTQALDAYADPSNWVCGEICLVDSKIDPGTTARQALSAATAELEASAAMAGSK